MTYRSKSWTLIFDVKVYVKVFKISSFQNTLIDLNNIDRCWFQYSAFTVPLGTLYIEILDVSGVSFSARCHITVITQINKSVVYFTAGSNVKFWCSEC